MIKHLFKPFAFLRNSHKIMRPQLLCAFNTTKKTYGGYKKPASKQENMGSIMVKNDNLKFDTEGYEVNFYPFHPEVIKKSATLYEINKQSSVVALNFIKKNPQGRQITAQSSRQNWQNRKSIAFRFNELSNFMQVNVHEEGTWVVEVDRSFKEKKKVKTMTFSNQKKSKFLNVTVEQNSSQDQWKIQTRISHSQFSLFQFLLKESLYDLSGMKLMFDLRRNEQLAKMGEKDKAEVEKESLFRNYDNKDDVV